jgi:SAM-dependent methyltransferase
MTPAPVAPWRPLARALADVHGGDRDARLCIRSSLWEDEIVPATEYYRPFDVPLPEIERRALSACRGRVLDAGAGAGRHALELQRRGLDVVALDVAPEAVAVMRDRGVRDPTEGDVFTLENERFDTVLMLMHGLGVVGTLAGLARFLDRLPGLLRPGGQLLADSADLALAVDEGTVAQLADGGFAGEVEFQLVYGALEGRPYPWLFVDPGTLGRMAAERGLETRILARGDRGAFLARVIEGSRGP